MAPHATSLSALVAWLAACGSPPPITPNDMSVTVVDQAEVLDLVPPPDFSHPGPTRLSETGLYEDFPSRKLAPGVFRYATRYQLWSDGADKERYLLLPPSTQIDTTDMDSWSFPVGTRAWKEFTRDGVVVETRLLQKFAAGNGGDAWFKVAYLWNDAGTEANAVPDGQDNARGTMHSVPSQSQCEQCHYDNIKDVLIGVSAIQLSSASGQGPLSQLVAAGRLSNPPAQEFQPPGVGVPQDAIGYLHGNCGHCHNDQSFLGMAHKMRLRLLINATTLSQTGVYRTTLGAKAGHNMPGVGDIIITPGDPDKSQLWARMASRDLWAMPPICTQLVDPIGAATLRSWIQGL